MANCQCTLIFGEFVKQSLLSGFTCTPFPPTAIYLTEEIWFLRRDFVFEDFYCIKFLMLPFKIELSRGEICVANLKAPLRMISLGS